MNATSCIITNAFSKYFEPKPCFSATKLCKRLRFSFSRYSLLSTQLSLKRYFKASISTASLLILKSNCARLVNSLARSLAATMDVHPKSLRPNIERRFYRVVFTFFLKPCTLGLLRCFYAWWSFVSTTKLSHEDIDDDYLPAG